MLLEMPAEIFISRALVSANENPEYLYTRFHTNIYNLNSYLKNNKSFIKISLFPVNFMLIFTHTYTYM